MTRRRVLVAIWGLVPALGVLALLAYGFTREPRYIETQDEEDRARAFLDEFGITYPNARDPGGRIAIDYGVWGLPETFFIGPDGRITYKHIGTLGPGLIAAKLDEARRGVVSAAQGRGEYQSTR